MSVENLKQLAAKLKNVKVENCLTKICNKHRMTQKKKNCLLLFEKKSRYFWRSNVLVSQGYLVLLTLIGYFKISYQSIKHDTKVQDCTKSTTDIHDDTMQKSSNASLQNKRRVSCNNVEAGSLEKEKIFAVTPTSSSHAGKENINNNNNNPTPAKTVSLSKRAVLANWRNPLFLAGIQPH